MVEHDKEVFSEKHFAEAVKWICSMLQQIDVRIAVVDSKHITKEPSLKVELETVMVCYFKLFE